MIALFFTAFPAEADKYIKEVEEYESKEAEQEEEHYEEIKNMYTACQKKSYVGN